MNHKRDDLMKKAEGKEIVTLLAKMCFFALDSEAFLKDEKAGIELLLEYELNREGSYLDGYFEIEDRIQALESVLATLKEELLPQYKEVYSVIARILWGKIEKISDN